MSANAKLQKEKMKLKKQQRKQKVEETNELHRLRDESKRLSDEEHKKELQWIEQNFLRIGKNKKEKEEKQNLIRQIHKKIWVINSPVFGIFGLYHNRFLNFLTKNEALKYLQSDHYIPGFEIYEIDASQWSDGKIEGMIFPYGISKDRNQEYVQQRSVDFFVAVMLGDLETVKENLKKGFNHQHPVYRTNALLSASFYGHYEIVKELLKYGADPNKRDYLTGNTSIFGAISYRNVEIQEMLLKSGANPNTYNDSGDFPLFLAFKNRDYESCKTLLKHGANPNLYNPKTGTFCLYNVCTSKQNATGTSLLRLLGKYKANPHQKLYENHATYKKMLMCVCARKYLEQSFLYKYYLPFDIFKIILHPIRYELNNPANKSVLEMTEKFNVDRIKEIMEIQ